MTNALDSASMLDAALRISREIVAGAVWQAERCSWVGAMPEEAPGGRTTLTYRALGPDLYGGTAGVGLFLAELARATGDPDSRRTSLAALRHAVSRVDDIPPFSRLGLYAGRPGVALALALAARALDEPELETVARAIASSTARTREQSDEHDLMSGRAGAVVGLLALRALLDDDALLDAAVDHGEALLDDAHRTDAGICWRSPNLPAARGLTGYSHGAAGVAVALLELAAATAQQRYRDAAEAAFAYERALYDPAARNWPDLRSSADGRARAEPGFATFWCHGAPGGALARLRALELGGDGRLRGEACAGLSTTAAWVAGALASASVNYSLCHGLAGNAEILLECVSLLPGSTPDLVQRVALAGIDTYLARGSPWPSGAHGGATPCLFLGLAGIGRFYLRLAKPELPSLLLVRPVRSDAAARADGPDPARPPDVVRSPDRPRSPDRGAGAAPGFHGSGVG
jgi:lantibiotic modifying enzyme